MFNLANRVEGPAAMIAFELDPLKTRALAVAVNA
jgi:hypothetical protein